MDFDFRFSQFEILTGAGSALLCLFFVSIFSQASAIENEVSTAAAQAVESPDLYWSSVQASGQAVVLTGSAPDDDARDAAYQRAVAVRGVSSVDNQIQVIGDSGTCQGQIADYLKRQPIKFRSGKAELADVSSNTIAMLAMLVRRCATRVEVAGHTDAKGDAEVNLVLSQRRANTVAKLLVNHGVLAEKIEARGYGESQPIGDNATDEGRKKNRRIEIRVLGAPA